MERSIVRPNIRVLLAVVLCAAAFLTISRLAFADWDEQIGQGTEGSSLLGGSIDLANCSDGKIATWHKSKLTFVIVNMANADPATIQAVRAGLLEWNVSGNPYRLSEALPGTVPDITVQVSKSLGSASLLGTTSAPCRSSAAGITSASIKLAINGLPLTGIRHLSAHETGHALGLGHSNRTGDIMDPSYEKFLDGTGLICPSNLDLGGLTSRTDPYRILPLLWLALPVC